MKVLGDRFVVEIGPDSSQLELSRKCRQVRAHYDGKWAEAVPAREHHDQVVLNPLAEAFGRLESK